MTTPTLLERLNEVAVLLDRGSMSSIADIIREAAAAAAERDELRARIEGAYRSFPRMVVVDFGDGLPVERTMTYAHGSLIDRRVALVPVDRED